MSFIPPPKSLGQLKGVPFDKAENVALKAKARFDAYDKTLPDDGDKSRCKALLKLPEGIIFWSSKMAVDADGPAAGFGRLPGSKLDPTLYKGKPEGQDDTKFQFPDGKGGMPSETVPYIVLPLGSFRADTGLETGDVAIVIYGDKITAAIAGDVGPSAKQIGEGSIRVHEAFRPPLKDPCKKRNSKGYCQLIRNESIPEDVLFFVFPKSQPPGLTPENIELKVNAAAFALYDKLRHSKET